MPTTPAAASAPAAPPASSQPLIPQHLDVVYTWVDGTWPDYLATQRPFATSNRDLNLERTRDAHQLLRYSLRSLEQFCPWAGTVTLFTMRPQVPAWLRRDHPRLRLVHHDEIIPARHLPTFNSNAIESHLPALAVGGAPFLYLNDDFLFGAPTAPGDFYTADGRVRVFGSVCGEHLPFRIYDGRWKLVSLGPIEHAPILIEPALLAEALASRSDAVERTRGHKFRQDDDVRMDFLYRYHLLAHRPDRAVAEPAWRLLRYHRFHKVTNDRRAQQRALARLRRLRPKFFCLNDDQGTRPDPVVVAAVRAFLDELCPRPGSFEHPDA
jgi:hypothetical protein